VITVFSESNPSSCGWIFFWGGGGVESSRRDELKIFAGEVIRFGNHCRDPRWHQLDRIFDRSFLLLLLLLLSLGLLSFPVPYFPMCFDAL
jgi:hypothetical protein